MCSRHRTDRATMTLSMCRSQSHMSGMCLATSPEHNHLTAMFLPSQSDLETMFLPSHSDHNAMPSPSTCHLKWVISDVSFRCQQNSRNDVQTMSKRSKHHQNIISRSFWFLANFKTSSKHHPKHHPKHHLEIFWFFGEFHKRSNNHLQTMFKPCLGHQI